jgi:hypothetical protein
MANVIFVEGFDSYNGVSSTVGLASRGYSGLAGVSMVAGRVGGQAMQIVPTSTGSVSPGPAWDSVPTSFAFGMAVKSNLGSNTRVASINIKNGVNYQLGIKINADGSITVLRMSAANTAAATLGSTAIGVLLANTFQYLEAEIVISATVGVVNLYVDSVQVLALTGQNTANVAGGCDRFEYHTNATGGTINYVYDDTYVVDTNVKLGERRIEMLVPTSDVATGWVRNIGSTNFSAVDDGAAVNSDTDYVQGSVVGDVDTYGFSDLSVTPNTIDAVRVIAYAEKTDVGTRSINLQVKSGATTDNGANLPLLTTYSHFTRHLTKDPNGTIAWTAAAVNALTGGPRVAV